ncbi:U-box domain-containing protein 21-like [Miscanthus floridulus]|uniref:U-box domain-containing protein 21-like n=1 Tax=Miscanthus floridulus TaxID=154761 RepID=UPI00345B2E34
MSSQQLWTAPAKPEAPPEFLCPITLDLMQDPVAAPTGITYDRAAIESWLLAGGQRTCPVTHGELRAGDLVPNHTLRRLIQDWYATNRCCCCSVDRVRVPATPEEAAVAELQGATRAGDAERCAAAARGVRRLAWREAAQSRRRLESAGAARALAAAFTFFAGTADAAAAATDDVLDVVLAALVLVMPMDEEAILAMGSSTASVARLVAVAANGDLHRRLQAVVVIREIVSLSAYRGAAAGTIDLSANAEAVPQVLVKTIRDGICPPATRACLVAAYHLACTGESAGARLASAGIVTVLVELLVDADKSTAEKALAALDAALAASRDGRARARADALAMPVLVKKMFWVSDAATALVVSALLRICKKCPDDDAAAEAARRHAIVEALQLGALQKVLFLLQAGCRQETKENATELLRLMVRYQGRGEYCVDAMDLGGIKRETAIWTG